MAEPAAPNPFLDRLVAPWFPFAWSERLHRRFGGTAWRLSLVPLLALGCIPIYWGVNALGPMLGSGWVDPATALDDRIPILPWTVVIYMSLFWLFYPLSFLASPTDRSGRAQACALLQGLVLLQVVSNIVFVVSPTSVHLRAQAVEALANADAVSAAILSGVHAGDTSHSAWPSLHVSHAVLIAAAAHRWLSLRLPEHRAAIGIAVWTMTAMLAISTMTTGQHYLFDVVTGGALGALFWNRLLAPWFDRIDAMDDASIPLPGASV